MATNSILLTQAKSWAGRWRQSSNLKGFLIPKVNIDQIYAANPAVVQDIRVYLGIDDNNQPALMMVGVDAQGNDLIDEKGGYLVYDFCNPCPSNCDTKSPMFNV